MLHFSFSYIPAGNYMFKVSNGNTRQRCEICSKLTIKPPKRCHWRRFGGFIVNFEHISHLCSSVSIVNFEQANAGWDDTTIAFTPATLFHLQQNVWRLCYTHLL